MLEHRILSCFVMAALLGPVACDKSEDKAGGDKTAAKADGDEKKGGDAKEADAKEADAKEADAKEAGGGEVALEKLGLEAQAPAGSQVKDAIVGEGLMVQGPGLVVTVEEASDTRPKTVDEAKENANDYSPKNLEAEELEDGFVVTYENEGGMGANYFVNVRREIGGKTYWCETTAAQPEQQKNAVEFCKSLKA